MTWPKKYGGHERSFLERYVVTEEFRVANAPVRLHFVADRQSGPILLKYAQRAHQDRHPAAHLPGRGVLRHRHERARLGLRPVRRQDQGHQDQRRLAHQRHQDLDQQRASRHYLIGLFRTSPPTKENRRHGLTQFLVDMKTPGITVNPIYPDDRPARFQRGGVRGRLHAGRPRAGRDRRRLEAGDERARLRAQRAGAVPRDLLRADSSWSACWATSPTCAAPKGSAGWWRSCTRCGACRCRSPACCTPARSRWWKAAIVKDVGTIWEQKLPAPACATSPPSSSPRSANRATLRGAARLCHHDRAQAHHPGRHHRDPARHHRPRAGVAVRGEAAVPDIGKLLWPQAQWRWSARRRTCTVCAAGFSKSCEPSVRRQGLSGEPERGRSAGRKGLSRRSTRCRKPADLAMLIIPAEYVPAELERCGRAGIKAAVILSSGFAEEPGGAGARMQREIVATARRATTWRSAGRTPRVLPISRPACARISARPWTRMPARSCPPARSARAKCR